LTFIQAFILVVWAGFILWTIRKLWLSPNDSAQLKYDLAAEILWPCNDDRMRSHISICTSVSRCSLLAGGSRLWNHSLSRQPLGRLCNLSLFSSNGSLTRFDTAYSARIVRASFPRPTLAGRQSPLSLTSIFEFSFGDVSQEAVDLLALGFLALLRMIQGGQPHPACNSWVGTGINQNLCHFVGA
jgi:hypothetical protein